MSCVEISRSWKCAGFEERETGRYADIAVPSRPENLLCKSAKPPENILLNTVKPAGRPGSASEFIERCGDGSEGICEDKAGKIIEEKMRERWGRSAPDIVEESLKRLLPYVNSAFKETSVITGKGKNNFLLNEQTKAIVCACWNESHGADYVKMLLNDLARLNKTIVDTTELEDFYSRPERIIDSYVRWGEQVELIRRRDPPSQFIKSIIAPFVSKNEKKWQKDWDEGGMTKADFIRTAVGWICGRINEYRYEIDFRYWAEAVVKDCIKQLKNCRKCQELVDSIANRSLSCKDRLRIEKNIRNWCRSRGWTDILKKEGMEETDFINTLWERLFEKIHTFKYRSNLDSWIYSIASNYVRGLLRGKKTKPKILTRTKPNPHEETEKMIINEIEDTSSLSADRMTELQEIFRRVKERTEDSKARNRKEQEKIEVLLKRFVEGKKYKEIQKETGVPKGTVATWIKRAKDRFKENERIKDGSLIEYLKIIYEDYILPLYLETCPEENGR